MKFLNNITLPLALLNIYALNAMQPANLLERLDDQHRQEFTKLKDAYQKGEESVYYKPALERSRKNNSSQKAADVIGTHDTDTLITFLAENKLFWISEKQRTFLLHKAAAAGYTAFCQLLIAVKEFSVNAQDKQGCTPLHIAAVKRDLPTCMALLQHGARIDIRNKAARSPAQEALLLAEVNKPYELKDIITLLQQEDDITLSAPQKKVGSLFNAIAFHANQDSICTRLRLVITVDDRLTNQDEMGQTILHRLEKYLESAFSGYEEKYYCNDSRRAMRCQAATNIVTS